MQREGKRPLRRGMIFFSAGVLALALGTVFFYFMCYRVTPVFGEMIYEYGTSVSRDIEDYLSGTEWSLQLAELDLSQVDEGEPGIYEAAVHHGRKEYTYRITIRDTRPPRILRKEGQLYAALDTAYRVEDLIEGVSDADPRAEAGFCFRGEDEAQKEISFWETGEHQVEVLAWDRSGNESREEVSVIVDTPPAFSGIRDFYVALGSTPDYRASVEAWDDVDGNLTQAIRVDDSQVNLDQEGTYCLEYLVADQYGLEVREEAQVMVGTREEIQELIGSREINYREDAVFGAPNIYDAGVSGQEDMEETLEYMRPALVQLYRDSGDGRYRAGSGYIAEITEEEIYICTNRHVVEAYENWDIYFFDGTKVPARKLGVCGTWDVGVAAVSREDVPQELMSRLMTVHIDRTYWEGLDQQDIQVALERLDQRGGVEYVKNGNLIKIKQDFTWYGQDYYTEVTLKLEPGDSGSAVLDGYGNLVCMAWAYAVSEEETLYLCIPLDGVLEGYEEITGHLPYVY